jgi:isochorismate hydrolase
VEGSKGERKLPGTILRGRINLGLLNTTDLPIGLLNRYPQVIFEKRITDIFAHARLERLITELPPSVFIICGAGVAKGIVQAAIGLRKRKFGVILVTDAVLDLRDKRAEMAYRRMESKGVIFAPTAEIITPKVVARVKAFRTATAAQK